MTLRAALVIAAALLAGDCAIADTVRAPQAADAHAAGICVARAPAQ
jgi:hypothetical protein